MCKDCTNDVVCSVCGKEGHVFRLCPTSFANKVGACSDQDGADIVGEILEADRLEEIDKGVHNALSNIVSDVCAAEKSS